MTDKRIKNIKICTAFMLSFVFMFTALYSYRGNYKQVCELTFLSNLSSGIFLLIVGLLWICNKDVPQFLFLDFAILLFIVFGICMAFFKDFNQEGGFRGGFAFLHIVNPLLMLVFYLFFSNQAKVTWQFIFTGLTMPVAYLAFALIFGAATGNYIYPILNYTENGVVNTVLFIFGAIIGIIAIDVGLYFLNKFIHKYI